MPNQPSRREVDEEIVSAAAGQVASTAAREVRRSGPGSSTCDADLALSLLFGRLLESQLFRVRAHDPLVLGVAVTVVLVAALLAALLPGFRAAAVDPMVALRTE